MTSKAARKRIARRRAFAQAEMTRLGFAKEMKLKGPVRETVTEEDKAEIAAVLADRIGGLA